MRNALMRWTTPAARAKMIRWRFAPGGPMRIPKCCVTAALAVLPSIAGAAESPFVGNTLRATFRFTTQACKPNGECEPAQTGERTVHVYFGTQGNVFDYFGRSDGGFLQRVNKPQLTRGDMGGVAVQIETTWTLRGNTATHRLVGHAGGNTIQANFATFTVSGGRCVANLSWIRPGIRYRATYSRRECSITPGQVGR
jgi:hypothetical protein